MPTLLWLLTAPAFAYDPDSLRADASFGLFRDEYDYLREPATLAHQPGRHVFTVLGNQGGTDRFSLGWLGGLGPGVFGAIADAGVSGGSAHNETTTAATAVSGDTVTITDAWSRTRGAAAFLGYGVPLGDVVAVGIGAEASFTRWDASLAPEPGGVPTIGGTLEQTTVDGEATLVEDGAWLERGRELTAIVGVAVALGGAEVEADLHLRRSTVAASGETLRITPTTEYSSTGFQPDGTLENNLDAWVPGLAIDAIVPAGDRAAVRLFAEGARGSGRPAVDERFEGYDDDTDPAAPVSWTESERLVDPDFDLTEVEALLALHLDGDVTSTRFGVAVAHDRERFAFTRAAERDDGATITSTETRERLDQAYTGVSLPIAVEIAAAPRLVVRAGGRWVAAFVRYDGRSVLQTAPGEGAVTEDRDVAGDVNTYVQLATGFRYDAGERFSLDFVALGTGVGDDRVALDVTSVLVSGVFHL